MAGTQHVSVSVTVYQAQLFWCIWDHDLRGRRFLVARGVCAGPSEAWETTPVGVICYALSEIQRHPDLA